MKKILLDITFLLTFITGLLYLSGWFYYRELFAVWGVSITSYDISAENYIITGGLKLLSGAWGIYNYFAVFVLLMMLSNIIMEKKIRNYKTKKQALYLALFPKKDESIYSLTSHLLTMVTIFIVLSSFTYIVWDLSRANASAKACEYLIEPIEDETVFLKSNIIINGNKAKKILGHTVYMDGELIFFIDNETKDLIVIQKSNILNINHSNMYSSILSNMDVIIKGSKTIKKTIIESYDFGKESKESKEISLCEKRIQALYSSKNAKELIKNYPKE